LNEGDGHSDGPGGQGGGGESSLKPLAKKDPYAAASGPSGPSDLPAPGDFVSGSPAPVDLSGEPAPEPVPASAPQETAEASPAAPEKKPSIGNCPRCKHHPVLAPPAEALHESICPDCNGRFVPHEGTRHLVVEILGVEEGTLREMIGHFGAPLIDCPACTRPMSPVQVKGHKLELCQGCGGLWLEPGALSKISGGRYADVQAQIDPDLDDENRIEVGGHIFSDMQRWLGMLPMAAAVAGLLGPFAYVAGGLIWRLAPGLTSPFSGQTARSLFGSAVHAAFWPAIFIVVATWIAPKRKDTVATLLFGAATLFSLIGGLRAVMTFGSAGMVPLFGVANGLVGGFLTWRYMLRQIEKKGEGSRGKKGRYSTETGRRRKKKLGEDWPYIVQPKTLMSMLFTGSILGMSAFFVQTIYQGTRGAECPNNGKMAKEVTDDGYHGRFCVNPAGQKHGPFSLHEPDGSKVGEGRFVAGKQVGQWVAFHPGGKAAEKGSYFEGRKVGEWTRYSPAGVLSETANYLDDRLHGDFKRFNGSGKMVEEGNYDMGRKVGFWRTFHPDGKPASEGVFHNGKREGPFNFFAKDGTTTVRTYRAGKEVFD
jgi:antitoxin component YwqK of YwqJK toxin-antitoxin module/Zn-finger nucleic acid-binding protein